MQGISGEHTLEGEQQLEGVLPMPTATTLCPLPLKK